MNKNDVFFVQRLFELSRKMSKNIKIATKDDAANLYAYLKGYTSWSEMLLYEKNNEIEKNIKVESLKIKEKKFNDIYWEYSDDFLKKLQKENKHISGFNFVEKTNMLENLNIGILDNNSIIKSKSIALLDFENTLILSGLESNAETLLSYEIKELLKWDKSFILMGIDETFEVVSDLKKNNCTILGKNSKLNPLNDLFVNEGFEEYFKDKETEENIFEDIWINLIRLLKDDLKYKITPLFLKESIKIENLIQLMTVVDKEKNLEIKLLINYINKFLDIKYLKEKKSFFISENSLEKHFKQSYMLNQKLKTLVSLYDEEYFDENSDLSFFHIYENKKPLVILNCENKKLNSEYFEIYFRLLDTVIKEQALFIEKTTIANKRFNIPLIVFSADKIVSKNSMSIIVENNEFLKTHYFDLNPITLVEREDLLKKFIEKITQVLFLRQNIFQLNESLEIKMKNQTISWGVNFFYSQYNELRNLNNNEFLLWKKNKMENTLTGIEDFILLKGTSIY